MGRTNPILCPYCGAEMYARTVFSGGIYSTWYECLDCDASSPMYRAPDQIDAIYGGAELAQRRYLPPIKPLMLEELHEYLTLPVWTSAKGWGIVGLKKINEKDYRWVIGFAHGWEWAEDVFRKPVWSRRPTDEERAAAVWEGE